jgi:DNA polymerase/3'-5' exonuclease PolX
MDNRAIAERLAAHAHALEREDGNVYRVQAYRRAVSTILGLDQPVTALVAASGRKALAALPGIGSHLAFTIERLVRTGEFHTMIPETVPPAEHVSSLPGVGPALTAMLADRLGVTTVADLEAASPSK